MIFKKNPENLNNQNCTRNKSNLLLPKHRNNKSGGKLSTIKLFTKFYNINIKIRLMIKIRFTNYYFFNLSHQLFILCPFPVLLKKIGLKNVNLFRKINVDKWFIKTLTFIYRSKLILGVSRCNN